MRTLAGARTVRDQLLHDAEVGTWRYDPDSELYHFSSELALGHESAAAPVPLSMLRLVQHVDDQDKDTEIRERITTEGGSAEGEMRYRDGAGGWKTLRVHYRAGRKLASGKFEMFGVSQNVTELAAARDQARPDVRPSRARDGGGERRRLRDRPAHGPALVVGAVQAIAGPEAMARQERCIRSASITTTKSPRFARAGSAALRPTRSKAIDTRIYRPDGQGRWVRLFTRVQRSPTGENMRAVGLMLDIQRRRCRNSR